MPNFLTPLKEMETASRALELYFTVGNYLLVNPLVAKRHPKTGTYSCVLGRKIWLIPAAFIQIMSLASVMISDWSGKRKGNLLWVTIFLCFNTYVVVGLLKLWTSGRKFEKVLNSILHLEANMKAGGVGTGSLKYLMLFLVVATAYVIIHTSSIFMLCYLNMQRSLASAHFITHGPSNCTQFLSTGEPEACEVSVATRILAFSTIFGSGYTLLTSTYLNILCFIHALILLHFPRSLLNRLKSSCEGFDSHLFFRLTNDTLDMCGTIEGGLEMIVASFCFALIPYYCKVVEAALSQDSTTCKQKLISAIVFIIILLTAAEANSKMKKVGAAIAARLPPVNDSACRRMSQQSERELSLILMQRLSENEYGLQGKAFTITYSLVGNVAGVVMTYSIIIYQLRNGNS